MALSIEEFTSRLLASGLMTQPELTKSVSNLPPEDRPQDGEQLAKRLVKQKLLTAYQAQCVYSGKTKNLVLGNYVVVDKPFGLCGAPGKTIGVKRVEAEDSPINSLPENPPR